MSGRIKYSLVVFVCHSRSLAVSKIVLLYCECWMENNFSLVDEIKWWWNVELYSHQIYIYMLFTPKLKKLWFLSFFFFFLYFATSCHVKTLVSMLPFQFTRFYVKCCNVINTKHTAHCRSARMHARTFSALTHISYT